MENKRPVGHGKKVGAGSAHAEKGEKVSSRPVGTGSGRTGSFDQRPGQDRAGDQRSTAGKVGLLAAMGPSASALGKGRSGSAALHPRSRGVCQIQ